AAMERLASEAKASAVYRVVESVNPSGYAGSWYDADSGQLVVAITETRDEALVKRLGAATVSVQHSLVDLEKAQHWALDDVGQKLSHGAIRHYYVDFRRNKAVIGVIPDYFDRATELVSAATKPVLVELAQRDAPRFTSGPIHGADAYKVPAYGAYFCSVGAPVNGGF